MSHQNNFDEKAMAILLLKTQEQLMQLMAQHQISSPNKELPQELQQLMENQTRIVRMMWQVRTNSNDEATPTVMGNQESKGNTWIKPVAYKTCGENSSHNLHVKPNKKDLSLVQCFTCKEMGHYSWDCPEKKKKNKMNVPKWFQISGGSIKLE